MKVNNKKFFIRTSLLLIGVLVAFVLVEFFIRIGSEQLFYLIRGESRSECRAKDELLDHVLVPNCVGVLESRDYKVKFRTNSYGLRGEQFLKEKGDNEFRVLVLGDSFVEGWGVSDDQVFTSIANNKSQEFTFINAGVASYSPILELEYLIDKGLEFDPDLVILFLDSSDLHDDYLYGGWERHERLRKKLGSRQLFKDQKVNKVPRVIKIFEKSKFINFFISRTYSSILNSRQELTEANLGTDFTLWHEAKNWKDYKKAWALPVSNVVLIKNLLKQKGIEFAVAVMPRGNHVSSKEWLEGRAVFGIEDGVAVNPPTLEIPEELLRNQEIEIIDILESLQEASRGPGLLFFLFDGHLTTKGHQVIADVLIDFLSLRNQ